MQRVSFAGAAAQLLSLVALAALLGGDARDARAETGPGSLTGTVTDDTGAVMPGVSVTITSLERKTAVTIQTDTVGVYVKAGLLPGRYQARAELTGFRPALAAAIDVGSEGPTHLDFKLELDLLFNESVVVTGTRNPLTKLESSVAISTLTGRQIDERAARSTADLLKAVPGFYVESSGGEVGGNLWARGLPADGSYRYVALLEDGMPVYDSTELFFVNADIFVRSDENVEELEAVRGGNSALFGSNAPGGAINFISKTGGDQPHTLLKLTGGTSGLGRVGFNTNGAAAEVWNYSLGGFYRYDRGVRDPGYPASQGGQLKANVTRRFDKGYARLYAKYLNDRNVFYLPLPFKAGGDFVDGFPSDGTLQTPEGNFVRVPRPNGDSPMTIPLEDGQRQVGGSAMFELFWQLDNGWQVKNMARVMGVDHTWNALLPFGIETTDGFAKGFVPAGGRYTYSFANHPNEAFGTSNGLLLTAGLWRVEKPMSSFADQFQLTKKFDKHELSLGVYGAHYSAGNLWYWSNVLTDVRTQPRFVDLTVYDASGKATRVTDNGFTRYGSLYANGTGNVDVATVFADEQIRISDKLRLSLGARYEHNTYRQNSENGATFDLGDPTTLADDQAAGGTGAFTHGSQDFDEWAASVGVNYLLSQRVSLWGRASHGYKMPILDNYLFGPTAQLESEQIDQLELGAKIGTPKLGLNVSGYYLTDENFPSQDARVVDGETVFVTDYVGKARTLGAEVELVVEPVRHLRLNGSVTLQDPEFVTYVAAGQDLGGKRPRRIPRIFANVTAGYFGSKASLSYNLTYFGDRFAEDPNLNVLSGYSESNARAAYSFSPKASVSLAISNIFDGKGLTEGNPRVVEAQGVYYLARPILPRRATVALEYSF